MCIWRRFSCITAPVSTSVEAFPSPPLGAVTEGRALLCGTDLASSSHRVQPACGYVKKPRQPKRRGSALPPWPPSLPPHPSYHTCAFQTAGRTVFIETNPEKSLFFCQRSCLLLVLFTLPPKGRGGGRQERSRGGVQTPHARLWVNWAPVTMATELFYVPARVMLTWILCWEGDV